MRTFYHFSHHSILTLNVLDANVDILTPKVLAMSLSEQQAPTTDYGEPRRPPTVNDGELRQPPTSEELYSHPDMSLKENADVLQLKSLAIQKVNRSS